MRCVTHCLCKKPCTAVFVLEGRGRRYRQNQEASSVYLFCRQLFLAHGMLSRVVKVPNTQRGWILIHISFITLVQLTHARQAS